MMVISEINRKKIWFFNFTIFNECILNKFLLIHSWLFVQNESVPFTNPKTPLWPSPNPSSKHSLYRRWPLQMHPSTSVSDCSNPSDLGRCCRSISSCSTLPSRIANPNAWHPTPWSSTITQWSKSQTSTISCPSQSSPIILRCNHYTPASQK